MAGCEAGARAERPVERGALLLSARGSWRGKKTWSTTSRPWAPSARYAVLIAHWRTTFGLRPVLTEAKANDLLLMLSGPAIYRELVVENGWCTDDYRTWLHSELLALLAPLST